MQANQNNKTSPSQSSDERLTLAFEATRDGIWDWDVNSGQVFFSPQWARLLGFEPEEVEQHVSFFRDLIHPEDAEKVQTALNEHFQGSTPEKQLEVRLRTKSGDYKWFLDRGKVVQSDSSGKPSRMVGTITDITDRKKAERNSEGALSLLRATLDSTNDAILVVNSEGQYQISNRAFREMFNIPDKLSDDENEAVNIRLIVPQVKDSDQFVEKILYLFAHPDASSFDTVYMKDGRAIERHSCPQMLAGKVVGRVWTFRDVTERNSAEVAVKETLSLLQKLASRVPGAVYQYRLRPDGTTSFPYASEGIREFFDVDPEVLKANANIGNRIVDYDAFQSSVQQSARDLTPWVHEMQLRRADGSVCWVAGSSVPEREPDGSIIWHGFITNITERKLAESKLRESERRLREAQAISQIGNFHWDAYANKVTWSDQLYRLYERDQNTFEPSFDSYTASIHPDDRTNILQQLQAAMTNKSSFDHQYRIILDDGQMRWVRARGNALVNSDGQFIGLEGTCQDISEQKQIEATTASLEAQLRESQKMEAIGTLAGGIAHDFNNILATILGNVEIAIPESAGASPVVQNCLVNIRNAGDRARDLVQQILSFSRRQPTQRNPISLVEVVDEVAKLLMATLPSSLSLDVQCSLDRPCIMGDATQIQQVLLNLATNSMQAMNGDRGCIRIRLDTVVLDRQLVDSNSQLSLVQSRSVGPVVRLRFSDDGPGMNSETLNRIFEPFFTTKPIDQGTGLGLSVVHGIVQRHDGTVIVESQPEHGTTFTIYLPAILSTGESQTMDALPTDMQSTSEHAKAAHVLYIDDDEAVLEVAQQLLERGGFRTSCFSDYQSALDALRSNPLDFDLVVTDYNMPGMHGLEVAREIRKIRQVLPVVITSGYVDAELTAGAQACGVQELVAKPFRLVELYSVIQRLVKNNGKH